MNLREIEQRLPPWIVKSQHTSAYCLQRICGSASLHPEFCAISFRKTSGGPQPVAERLLNVMVILINV
jgi:hypothetical protein